MGVCDGCGAEVSDEELYKWDECGKAYAGNALQPMESLRRSVYAQTAKRFMKLKKTTGVGNSRRIRKTKEFYGSSNGVWS